MKSKGSTEQDYGIIKYRKMEKRRNTCNNSSSFVIQKILYYPYSYC